ncbi:MAG: hypothetical protein R2710_13815 [Acidimicrobiales bacterium]
MRFHILATRSDKLGGMRCFFALLFSFALIAAACSGSGSGGGDALPTTVDPDGLPEDTVLFDDDGGDTETSPTETTSVETTTTAPPTPASTPSLAIFRFGTLGGWTGSGWHQDDSSSPDDVGAAAGDQFQMAGIGVEPGTVEGGAPMLVCEPAGGFGVETSPELPYDGFDGSIAIGVRADWNALPRTAAVTAGGTGVYLDEVARLIGQNGIDPALATVDSVARVDLEGDGVDEVVVTANRSPNWPEPEAGNYSLVFLRKLVDEEVQTAILFSTYLAETPPDFYWVRARLAGFADLNGDAKLEILMASEYYEGAGIEAFEYVNDDLGPVSVIGSGCGA